MTERRFANLVLLAGAGLSGTAGLVAALGRPAPGAWTGRTLLLVGGCLFLGSAFLAALRLPLSYRVGLAVTLVSLLVAAYVAEYTLRWVVGRRVRTAAERLGNVYDGRTRFEVVRDLRHEGKDAWPAAFPAAFLQREDELGLLPLGGISGVLTVCCNEVGPYLTYVSDERGFYNPPGLWGSAGLSVAVLGDSYAHGACVPPGQSAVDRIRREYPGTLNLGIMGNGPLLMLAGLREYLPDLRPQVILWLYYEGNDLVSDLGREKKSALLLRYLEPGYRQQLASRQPEINATLRRAIDEDYEERTRGDGGDNSADWWQGLLRLRSLRQAVGLQVAAQRIDYSRVDYDLFRRILNEARLAAEGWGGRLYFVYFPFGARFVREDLRRENDRVRERVLGLLRELGVPLIDVEAAFARHPEIGSLYAFPGAHCSPAGYSLAARTVIDALKADRVDPGPETW